MSKLAIANVFGGVQTTMKQHMPELLTGAGIAGMIATTIFAVKGTPKALRLIEEEKAKQETDKLTPVDTVKATWKCYIPAAVTGALSIACLVGGSTVSAKRNAALAAAYSLSESAIREYKDKVIETIGEEKEREVRDAVAKSRIENDPVSNQEIVDTKTGQALCYDILSGRYFYSNAEKIERCVNAINKKMLNNSYVSLNDFFYELGLEGTTLGENLGWSISQGMVTVDFSTQLSENDVPCLVIDYDRLPTYDFDRWF